ncbi:hypothetical protein BC829DRAFT_444989 [Chytridium lagenaria]|nr:hypothetical protein BC829DRAFT_444989 [Chytridium lagenaria]
MSTENDGLSIDAAFSNHPIVSEDPILIQLFTMQMDRLREVIMSSIQRDQKFINFKELETHIDMLLIEASESLRKREDFGAVIITLQRSTILSDAIHDGKVNSKEALRSACQRFTASCWDRAGTSPDSPGEPTERIKEMVLEVIRIEVIEPGLKILKEVLDKRKDNAGVVMDGLARVNLSNASAPYTRKPQPRPIRLTSAESFTSASTASYAPLSLTTSASTPTSPILSIPRDVFPHTDADVPVRYPTPVSPPQRPLASPLSPPHPIIASPRRNRPIDSIDPTTSPLPHRPRTNSDLTITSTASTLLPPPHRVALSTFSTLHPPTLSPVSRRDAELVHTLLGTIKVDAPRLVELLATRSPERCRDMAKAYEGMTGVRLASVLKEKTFNEFSGLVVGMCCTGRKSLNVTSKVSMQIFVGKSNAEIQAIKSHFVAASRSKQPLTQYMSSRLGETTLFSELLTIIRHKDEDNNDNVDPTSTARIIRTTILNAAPLTQNIRDVFRILCRRSYDHIRQTSMVYACMGGSGTKLSEDIDNWIKSSVAGEVRELIVSMVRWSEDAPLLIAQHYIHSLKGLAGISFTLNLGRITRLAVRYRRRDFARRVRLACEDHFGVDLGKRVEEKIGRGEYRDLVIKCVEGVGE